VRKRVMGREMCEEIGVGDIVYLLLDVREAGP
jgi:hypothetical protein